MDDRDILANRLRTLDGLLAAPAPLSGGPGQVLNREIRDRWDAERRLLARLLEDTPGPNVRDTVALWYQRTTRFLESSADAVPGWVDGRGMRWEARQVLDLLEETRELLRRWAGHGPPDASSTPASSSAEAQPPPGSGD
jgi:hypothetical protein